jgi:hypothetical protein
MQRVLTIAGLLAALLLLLLSLAHDGGSALFPKARSECGWGGGGGAALMGDSRRSPGEWGRRRWVVEF